MNDLTIFVNTHSSCADCWPMFFGQLLKHWPTHPRAIVASNRILYSTERACEAKAVVQSEHELQRHFGVEWLVYRGATKFSNQYLMGLCAVETPYVLTMQEDFILYADVNEAQILGAMDTIEHDGRCAAVRLIDSGRNLRYSMQATVWETSALKYLYVGLVAATPWEAEIVGDALMRQRGVECELRYDDQLPMRGRNHRDSPIFPYISTALVRGKWNADYRAELTPLLKQYDIEPSTRGWTE